MRSGCAYNVTSHRRGILSEAALALEAEVTAHPGNAEAWRLLGTVHAENDDDTQVGERERVSCFLSSQPFSCPAPPPCLR